MALLVKISSKKDEKYVAELLSKLGYSTESVDANGLEDLAYGAIMKKNNKKDLLSVHEAKAEYKKLNKKK